MKALQIYFKGFGAAVDSIPLSGHREKLCPFSAATQTADKQLAHKH